MYYLCNVKVKVKSLCAYVPRCEFLWATWLYVSMHSRPGHCIESFTLQTLSPQGKSPWLRLFRRPNGPQSTFGLGGGDKILPLPAIEPRLSSPQRVGLLIKLLHMSVCTLVVTWWTDYPSADWEVNILQRSGDIMWLTVVLTKSAFRPNIITVFYYYYYY